MKIENPTPTFKELQDWFESTELPATLDGQHKYYSNVQKTAELYIFNIEFEMKGNEKPTRNARIVKHNLNELYNDLQVLENWNKPRPTLNDFNNTNKN